MAARDVETRLRLLETAIGELREEVALSRTDAIAARELAAGADRDVSEVRAELRAHTQTLNALRENQLDLQAEVREGFADVRTEMRTGFAEMRTGMAHIIELTRWRIRTRTSMNCARPDQQCYGQQHHSERSQ